MEEYKEIKQENNNYVLNLEITSDSIVRDLCVESFLPKQTWGLSRSWGVEELERTEVMMVRKR